MAYALNSIDLSTYGIIEGRIRGGNVALQGQYDFPSRIGDVLHEWGDENYPEIYTDTDEMFWGGRDLTFEAHIPGTRSAIYDALASFYAATTAPSGLQSFATPYGTFNVYPKAIAVTHGFGATALKVTFGNLWLTCLAEVFRPASGCLRLTAYHLRPSDYTIQG